MRLFEYEAQLRLLFTKASIDSPELCARLLVAHAAGLDKIDYILAREQRLPADRALLLKSWADRRANGEPLAYILGKKEFYGREFLINSSSLIPRPESELMIEILLATLPGQPLTFADLGTGSGCLGLTLLLERPLWNGFLLDLNWHALCLAQNNARKFQCNPVIINADIFSSIFLPNSLDLIISNPPYISCSEIDSVMAETLAFEPHYALFSANNGLEHLRAVIEIGTVALKPDGWLIMEHGYNQASAVKNFLTDSGYKNIKMYKDLAELPRCCMAQL